MLGGIIIEKQQHMKAPVQAHSPLPPSAVVLFLLLLSCWCPAHAVPVPA